MKFFPYEDFYIITSLKPEEVETRLQSEMEPNRGFSLGKPFSSSNRYFSGYVVNGVFEFKRIISYRNSFVPQIKGSIEPWLNGSRMHVTMTMQIFVNVFMGMWLGSCLVFGLFYLIQELNNGPFQIVDMVPFGMFLFGYVLCTGGFKYESSTAKDKLLKMLNGVIE